MFKIKPVTPEVTVTRLAWPDPALTGSPNTATSSTSYQQVHASQGASTGGGTRIDGRTVSPLHLNPVLTPMSVRPNVIPGPDVDAEAQAGAPVTPTQEHSDSESRSVLPVDAAPPQPEPEPSRLHCAVKGLIVSLPLTAAIALMVDGSKQDDDAELAAGAALLTGILAGMAINSLVDCVKAWCGGGATAS